MAGAIIMSAMRYAVLHATSAQAQTVSILSSNVQDHLSSSDTADCIMQALGHYHCCMLCYMNHQQKPSRQGSRLGSKMHNLVFPSTHLTDSGRAEATIIAALLHDVLDDTSVKAQQVEEQFGSDVVHMVAQVSQLSSMNQLLRRRRRQMVSQIFRFKCQSNSRLHTWPVKARQPAECALWFQEQSYHQCVHQKVAVSVRVPLLLHSTLPAMAAQ